jgi:hypothetical protein
MLYPKYMISQSKRFTISELRHSKTQEHTVRHCTIEAFKIHNTIRHQVSKKRSLKTNTVFGDKFVRNLYYLRAERDLLQQSSNSSNWGRRQGCNSKGYCENKRSYGGQRRGRNSFLGRAQVKTLPIHRITTATILNNNWSTDSNIITTVILKYPSGR